MTDGQYEEHDLLVEHEEEEEEEEEEEHEPLVEQTSSVWLFTACAKHPRHQDFVC